MRLFKVLWPYLRVYRFQLLLSLILAIPLSALRAAPVPLVQQFINDLSLPETLAGDRSKLLIYPAVLVGIALVNFVVRFFHYYLLKTVIIRTGQKLKNNLFEHVVGLSVDFFGKNSSGTLMSRVASDVQFVDGGIASISTLIREPVTFLFLLGYSLHLNWRLTLLTFLIFPPLAFVFKATSKNLRRYIGKIAEENALLFSTMQESFSGIRMVQSFQLEKYVRRRFRERSEGFARFLLKAAALEEAAHPLVELLTYLAVAVVVYYGGKQVLDGEMKAGDLMAFFLSFGMMMNPIRLMNEVNVRLQQALAAVDRIFEVFSWKSSIVDPVTYSPVGLSDVKTMGSFRSLEFKNVTFAYPDHLERSVLKNISFRIKPGQVVALVGQSGSGKSSIASLLPRFFDVVSGEILVNGVNIKHISLSELRRVFSVVSQEVFLFNDSISENIRCGRFSATREDVVRAATHAHADRFIANMPEKYDSVIGDRGQKLSGGERQRISIARAFLRESPVLILDEATSALDSQSERAVQEAIDSLMKDRTSLVIAHRLSTIEHADLILVLKDGEIIERGNHRELLHLGGEYSKLWGMQT